MRKCFFCGKMLNDGYRFCTECGKDQNDSNVPSEQNKSTEQENVSESDKDLESETEQDDEIYYDQEETPEDDQKEDAASFDIAGVIPKDAKCKYCAGLIDPETGECKLCHRPFFEKVEEDVNPETAEKTDNTENILKPEKPEEPKCKYCAGLIDPETNKCKLCGRLYNSTEDESESGLNNSKNTKNVYAYRQPVDHTASFYDNIKNSNSQYKEDLEKYGTSQGSYDRNIFFSRVGRKIMGLAKFIFWSIVIINGIAAVVMIVNAIKIENGTGKAFMILGAIVVIALGVLIGWLSSILLYGYGQLIESQQSTVDELKEIKHLLRKTK